MDIRHLARIDRDDTRTLISFVTKFYASDVVNNVELRIVDQDGCAGSGAACCELGSKHRESTRRHLVIVRVNAASRYYPENNLVERRRLFPESVTREDAEKRIARLRWKGFDAEIEASTYYPGTKREYTRWAMRYVAPYGGISSPVMSVNDWREKFVTLLAHELMHVDQFISGRKLSEVECERAANDVLARYREELT
jgi:hypothetical protein